MHRSDFCVTFSLFLGSRFYFFSAVGWQEPAIAQLAQLQPQEDFPFFLFLTRLAIIAATTAASTRVIITVAKLFMSQVSI